MVQTGIIMIVGAGQMGKGLAQLAARSGYTVLLNDLPGILEKSFMEIEMELAGRKDLDAEGRQQILEKIKPAASLQEAVHSDYIIEAATENVTIKKQIFATLSNYITQHTILATNTSSLSITDIASASDCPEKVVGMHFMNPVSSMMVVEIIRGLKTSDHACKVIKELAETLGKEAIEVNDYPGFVSNRLLMPMINEAIICVFDGVADVESVDRIMQLGLRHPLGPLRLADMIGLDACLSIMEILHREFDHSKYRPCPLLRTMVKAGKLGRKSGEGFYLYDN